MASRLPQIGVSLAEENRQLKEQNKKLIPEVIMARGWKRAARKYYRLARKLDAEIIRNRETIAVQGKRIQELERALQALCAAHRTVDPAPVYLVAANDENVGMSRADAEAIERIFSGGSPAAQFVDVNA